MPSFCRKDKTSQNGIIDFILIPCTTIKKIKEFKKLLHNKQNEK